MFSDIVIKSLKNKRKIDIFDLISKIKKFKSKSNTLINRIFLFKINRKDSEKSENENNFDNEKNDENEIKFENIL